MGAADILYLYTDTYSASSAVKPATATLTIETVPVNLAPIPATASPAVPTLMLKIDTLAVMLTVPCPSLG